jgi:hypothetical protein
MNESLYKGRIFLFVVYLTVLSVDQIIVSNERTVNIISERMWKEAVMV